MPFDIVKFTEMIREFLSKIERKEQQETIDHYGNSYRKYLAEQLRQCNFPQMAENALGFLKEYALTSNSEAVKRFEKSAKQPLLNERDRYLSCFGEGKQFQAIKHEFSKAWDIISSVNNRKSQNAAVHNMAALLGQIGGLVTQEEHESRGLFSRSSNVAKLFYNCLYSSYSLLSKPDQYAQSYTAIRSLGRIYELWQERTQIQTNTAVLYIQAYLQKFIAEHPELGVDPELQAIIDCRSPMQERLTLLQIKLDVLEKKFPNQYKTAIKGIKAIAFGVLRQKPTLLQLCQVELGQSLIELELDTPNMATPNFIELLLQLWEKDVCPASEKVADDTTAAGSAATTVVAAAAAAPSSSAEETQMLSPVADENVSFEKIWRKNVSTTMSDENLLKAAKAILDDYTAYSFFRPKRHYVRNIERISQDTSIHTFKELMTRLRSLRETGIIHTEGTLANRIRFLEQKEKQFATSQQTTSDQSTAPAPQPPGGGQY
jgi:hypothetical protein